MAEIDLDVKAKKDIREAKGGWAPGSYMCRCVYCKEVFMGDKRAVECADCAYAPPLKVLKLKYRNRLDTMKENRANECDNWNDAQNELADREIEMTAEFCRDLNNLDNGEISIIKLKEEMYQFCHFMLKEESPFASITERIEEFLEDHGLFEAHEKYMELREKGS